MLGEASPSLLIQREGDTVDMFCESAGGTPTPTLTWYKDGRELVSGDHVTIVGRRVRLLGLSAADGGLYTCTFSNAVGSISHHIKLVIQGRSTTAPKNVRRMFPPIFRGQFSVFYRNRFRARCIVGPRASLFRRLADTNVRGTDFPFYAENLPWIYGHFSTVYESSPANNTSSYDDVRRTTYDVRDGLTSRRNSISKRDVFRSVSGPVTDSAPRRAASQSQ